MLTPGDAHRGHTRRTAHLALTRHPERLVHRAPKPDPLPAAFSINPPGAALGNHEAMAPKTLMDRERRTWTGWMGRFDDLRTEGWIQAPWRLPVTTAVATEHGYAGTLHEAVVDRNWRRTTEGIERRDPGGGLDRAPGGHGSDWRGRPGASVEGVRALVSDRERVLEAHAGGCWWRFDPEAGFAGLDRLALLAN